LSISRLRREEEAVVVVVAAVGCRRRQCCHTYNHRIYRTAHNEEKDYHTTNNKDHDYNTPDKLDCICDNRGRDHYTKRKRQDRYNEKQEIHKTSKK